MSPLALGIIIGVVIAVMLLLFFDLVMAILLIGGIIAVSLALIAAGIYFFGLWPFLIGCAVLLAVYLLLEWDINARVKYGTEEERLKIEERENWRAEQRAKYE